MPKRILLTGCTGYVGQIICRYLPSDYELYGISRKPGNSSHVISCDVTSECDIKRLARDIQPEVIIYAAGNKDIAFCEKNHREAYSVNGYSVGRMIESFPNSRIIYISSDYVFDGQTGDYKEEAKPNPQTIYGKSKLLGEFIGLKAAAEFVVVRISALFDYSAKFPQYILANLRKNVPIDCYKDVYYSPTYYDDLIKALTVLMDKKELSHEILHCSGEFVSRWEFAYKFAIAFGLDAHLVKGNNLGPPKAFFYPNLSLNDDFSRHYLGLPKRTLSKTLEIMKGDLLRETDYPLQRDT